MKTPSLNHAYRLIWSHVLNAWVAVAESAKGQGKSASRSKIMVTATAAAAALSLGLAPLALAAPTDGQVVAGAASISQAGNTTTINQSSQNLAINWQDFSIAANEAVRFNQPNSASIVLNRVIGQSNSQIFGAMSANGQVFILNPNGVLFGAGSQVNVGGLVASTLSLSNDDFLAGKYNFANNGGAGSITNQGTLTAAQSGYIALLAPEVINDGIISATLGKAVLAAGDQVTLNLSQGSLLGFNIDKGAFKALVDNKQLIEANGGQVFMSAKAADAITTAMVNNTGIIEARTMQMVNGTVQMVSGRIELMNDMQVGTVNVGGILDASAPNGGDGGFIETSAAHVQVADNAKVTTLAAAGQNGTWLIDPPVDFTIAASGGNMTGTVLASSLALGGVTIVSTTSTVPGVGDINVNDVVTWSANKLTLNAQNNININADMNASATASLALEYGQSAALSGNNSLITTTGAVVNLPAGTSNFTTRQGSDGLTKNYTVITSLGIEGSLYSHTDLQGMSGGGNINYALGSDIDASDTIKWNSGAGFNPIWGYGGQGFTNSFDGLGHTISNLYENRPVGSSGLSGYQGLFGQLELGDGDHIQNLGLLNVNITGTYFVGGLAGSFDNTRYTKQHGSVNNVHVTGNVTLDGLNNQVGGLLGICGGCQIYNSSSSANVIGNAYVGGLVGSILTTAYEPATISNSWASGDVNGNSYVGGLVGLLSGNSSLKGDSTVFSRLNNSYATGDVSGNTAIGGLAGQLDDRVGVYDSYATGDVAATTGGTAGGLTGSFRSDSKIINSYATGYVSGGTYNGALAVATAGVSTVTNSFYDSTKNPSLKGMENTPEASGMVMADAAGTVVGMSTADMKVQVNFTSATSANGNQNPSWDFVDTWKIDSNTNSGYPVLKWQTIVARATPATLATTSKSDALIAAEAGRDAVVASFSRADTRVAMPTSTKPFKPTVARDSVAKQEPGQSGDSTSESPNAAADKDTSSDEQFNTYRLINGGVKLPGKMLTSLNIADASAQDQ
ncbi:MAG: filamentous hemagglutinin family protein [Methylophilaceae bacterium]|jgi:filamentous hemagglutinin family protein